MEPSEFDKAIQGKLRGKYGIHHQEIDTTKLAIWSQVDHNLKSDRKISWYWLVAAAILLLITFSSLLFLIRENHQQQLSSLTVELSQTKEQMRQQSSSIDASRAQVSSLTSQLSLATKEPIEPVTRQVPVIKEIVIHQIDTVYITQIECVKVNNPETMADHDDQLATEEDTKEVVAEIKSTSTTPTFIAIASSQNSNNNNESLKVKFGSFTKKLRND